MKQEVTTAKIYFDLGVAKSMAWKQAIEEADSEGSRLLQMQLSEDLNIDWTIV